jgi:hypothetical protein
VVGQPSPNQFLCAMVTLSIFLSFFPFHPSSFPVQ